MVLIENVWLGREDTTIMMNSPPRAKIVGKYRRLSLNATLHLIDAITVRAFSLDRNRTTLPDQPGFDSKKVQALAYRRLSGLSGANLQLQATALDADLARLMNEKPGVMW